MIMIKSIDGKTVEIISGTLPKGPREMSVNDFIIKFQIILCKLQQEIILSLITRLKQIHV